VFPDPCTTISTESRFVVFEALPIVFVTKRHFSVAHLGLIYLGIFCSFARCLNLMYSKSCLHRNSLGRCNLRLASKGYGRARGEMGGFPTSREPADWCYDRWATSGDRLFLARLDRRVHSYPLVCSDALDGVYRLRGQLGVRFVLGKPPSPVNQRILISPPELHDGHILVSLFL
jgi:hypothetical protein